MLAVSIFIAVLYVVLITAFIIGFDSIAPLKVEKHHPKNTFSIVIPFRNEEQHLPFLLKSLGALNYPQELFEIILVDDDSNDGFQLIFDHFTTQHPKLNLKLMENLRSSRSPKKDAITTAVNAAKFDWIVTTDADCNVPLDWLFLFNQIIEEKQALFIGAPVKFREEKSFLYHFQNLHFTSLMGSTIGGFGLKKPFMCNGANLCYHKETFVKLNGFEGNAAIASGDDVFLLEKMYQTYPDRTSYLKSTDAIVETQSVESWRLFFNQQLRWVSKSTAYKNTFCQLVGVIVLLANLMLIILGISSILFSHFWKFFLTLLILKSIVDFALIFRTSCFLRTSKSLKFFVGVNLLYPFFIVFIGFSSLLRSYTWKGRSYKK